MTLDIIIADPKFGHKVVQVQLGKPSTRREVDTALEEYKKPGWFVVEETKRLNEARGKLELLDMRKIDEALEEYERGEDKQVSWHVHRVITGG